MRWRLGLKLLIKSDQNKINKETSYPELKKKKQHFGAYIIDYVSHPWKNS